METGIDIVRDPLWNNIRLDRVATRLIDTAAFQRLRAVRQLGHAYLVYPGATHSRFEHALGAWHLSGIALRLLTDEHRAHAALARDARTLHVVRSAALLHDIGHYPFSHAVEEIGVSHHEALAEPLILEGELADVLTRHIDAQAPRDIVALIRGTSTSPWQGLIAGSLDLDKLEYLKRDATMCGVPYGDIDVDRLLQSLTLVARAGDAAPTLGIVEKGVSALESLLFAKYQMYRNVYWHHAVRSATAMFKRLVAETLDRGALTLPRLTRSTDDALLGYLSERELAAGTRGLLDGLRRRRLHKRALERSASLFSDGAGEWIAADYPLTQRVENRLAEELALSPGDVLLDYPTKSPMLGLDIPLARTDGTVVLLSDRDAGAYEDLRYLPQLTDALYRSARRYRVFTRDRAPVPAAALLDLVQRSANDIRARLDAGGALLAGGW
jgi:hypothetical protein